MNCATLQGLLQRYLNGSLPAPVFREAQEHLKHCAQCALLYEEERRFTHFLQHKLSSPRPPLGLETMVRDALIREAGGDPDPSNVVVLPTDRSSEKPESNWPVQLAAAVLLFLLGSLLTLLYLNPRVGESRAALFVEDFQRQELDPNRVTFESNSASQVRAWLEQRLDFPLHLPKTFPAGFALQGARLGLIGGERVGIIFLDKEDRRIQLSLLPSQRAGRARQTFGFKNGAVLILRTGQLEMVLVTAPGADGAELLQALAEALLSSAKR
jgi:anti-sigma factor RsiW